MESRIDATIKTHFAGLEDPRSEINREHKLLDMVVIAILAVICGANDWVAVAMFGRSKEEWLKTFLELPSGIPSHDTFWRLFRRLNPEPFQLCFSRWITAVSQVTKGQVVAIDGKALRRSFDKGLGQGAIHMVSAWASANRLVLGQQKVDEKSNEITAIPKLLQLLDLKGCLVTIDAMGCQTEIAQTIVEQGADYLLALKKNQENLYEDVVLLFDDLQQSHFRAYPHDHAKTVDKDHGRIEIRQAWTISDPKLIRCLRGAENWPNLRTVVKVQAERRLGPEVTVECRYFISSCAHLDAKQLLHAVRTHWRIENSLHWVLDIAFREDESRLRKDHSAQNFAILRRIALSLLKQDASARAGVQNRRLRAGWDHDYLLRIISPLFA